MLDQAVLAFGRYGILSICRINATTVDVETAFERVRIIQNDIGISLLGYRKATQGGSGLELITGIWTEHGGWRCSLRTVGSLEYHRLEPSLPR